MPTANAYASLEELRSFFSSLSQHPRGNGSSGPPVIFQDTVFTGQNSGTGHWPLEIRMAEQPLRLRRQTVLLSNPFGVAAWPLSYSVIYQRCLVVLFSPGKFACYRLADFSRNEPLEQQLNTQPFEQHWLFNGQLTGWHNGRAYAYDTVRHAWQHTAPPLPFDKQTKIYEDERFACSMVCSGEFGGLLYFYDKQTRRTHYVDATCGTSVWKHDGQYRVLTSLAHMSGSAHSGIIAAPETLPEASALHVAAQNWEYTFAHSIPNPAVRRVFAYYGLTMLGGLRWQNQTLYLVSWQEATFLATLAGGQLVVVDPLFNSSLTHTGLTIPYGSNLALTSLLRYKGRQVREAACLVIHGEQLTKIEWGK